MQRLLLGRGAHAACRRQRGREGSDFVRTPCGGMTLRVEQDEVADPAAVSVLCAGTQVSDAAGCTDLIQQIRAWRFLLSVTFRPLAFCLGDSACDRLSCAIPSHTANIVPQCQRDARGSHGRPASCSLAFRLALCRICVPTAIEHTASRAYGVVFSRASQSQTGLIGSAPRARRCD